MSEAEERDTFRRVNDDEIHEMLIDYKEYKELESRNRKQLIICMNENKLAIEKLTNIVNDSNESTKGLVDTWNAAQGALKITAAFGSLVKWGVGIGGPLYALYLFIKHSGKVG